MRLRLLCFCCSLAKFPTTILCVLVLSLSFIWFSGNIYTWLATHHSQLYIISVGKSVDATDISLAVINSNVSDGRLESHGENGSSIDQQNGDTQDPLIKLVMSRLGPFYRHQPISKTDRNIHQHQRHALLISRVREAITKAGVPVSHISDSTTGKTSEHAGNNVLTDSVSATVNCSLVPLGLVGQVHVPSVAPSWSSICATRDMCQYLLPGGHYRPPDCIARHRVAVIVPYRDREEHLRLFLYHLHPILQRQKLDYTIFIVEQTDGRPFNRAMLLNVGAVEAMKRYNFQCFVFHDVDLLPEDDRILYSCPQHPRHLSVAVDILNYRLPYATIFGGASSMSCRHFLQVNGYSNRFWGWGGEDDDMSARIKFHRLFISRLPFTIARYRMLAHRKACGNRKRYSLLRRSASHFLTDGLTSLKYRLKQAMNKHLYTWLLADLNDS